MRLCVGSIIFNFICDGQLLRGFVLFEDCFRSVGLFAGCIVRCRPTSTSAIRQVVPVSDADFCFAGFFHSVFSDCIFLFI